MKPNPENYPAHYKQVEKLEDNPNFKRQYGIVFNLT